MVIKVRCEHGDQLVERMASQRMWEGERREGREGREGRREEMCPSIPSGLYHLET